VNLKERRFYGKKLLFFKKHVKGEKKMKKALVLISIFGLVLMIVSGLSLTGCKTTAVVETTAAATTAAVVETTAAVVETTAAATTELKKGPFKIAWNPKGLGAAYFNTCFVGAQEAAKELGFDIFEVGSDDFSVDGQIAVIESLIQQKVDAIGIAACDMDAIAPVCKKALDAGIHIVAWDAPVSPAARIAFVNQVSFESAGRMEVQAIAEMMNFEGEFAIISAAPQMPNQQKWVAWMYEELKDPKYAKMKLVDLVYGDDAVDKSYDKALGLFKAYPNLKGIISPTAMGLSGTLSAIEDQGLIGKVYATGLTLPSIGLKGMKAGATKKFFLWNTFDLGYVAASALYYAAQGDVTTDPETGYYLSTAPFSGKVESTFNLGRAAGGWPDKNPTVTMGQAGNDPEIILGPLFAFTPENIDEWAAKL